MDAALVGGVAALERAVAYLLGCLVTVTPDELERPTPCRFWDVYDLLDHLEDSLGAMEEAVVGGRVAPPGLRPSRGAAIVTLVRERAVRLLGEWVEGPSSRLVRVGPAAVTAPVVAGAGALEITVHGWDIAAACGRPRAIPDELADELLDLSVLMVRGPDRPGRFARPVPVPAHAPPGERLLAFLGRAPGG